MAATLTPIQTLKFRFPLPKPLFSPKPPSLSTPHTFRADKLTVSAATSAAAAAVSSNGPPSPPSPARSKHVLYSFHSVTPLVSYCSDSLLIDDD
ncbi:Acetolactate synthase small subunit [Spatholobus suberectus]|nr:Acetolactate synthase small subunit [Spatholobus suberectus]